MDDLTPVERLHESKPLPDQRVPIRPAVYVPVPFGNAKWKKLDKEEWLWRQSRVMCRECGDRHIKPRAV